MNNKESIEIVKKFNQENRYRDCGKINNAIDKVIELAEKYLEIQSNVNEYEIINYLKNKIDKTMPQYTETLVDGKVYRIENIPLETNFSQKTSNMVQKLIDLYQEQKQLNEVHQKINGELRIKVKELEKFKLYYQNEINLLANYVHKDKIKEKIEEVKNSKENYTFSQVTSEDIRRTIITNLQELLGE